MRSLSNVASSQPSRTMRYHGDRLRDVIIDAPMVITLPNTLPQLQHLDVVIGRSVQLDLFYTYFIL